MSVSLTIASGPIVASVDDGAIAINKLDAMLSGEASSSETELLAAVEELPVCVDIDGKALTVRICAGKKCKCD